jgi:hypothetical protein
MAKQAHTAKFAQRHPLLLGKLCCLRDGMGLLS